MWRALPLAIPQNPPSVPTPTCEWQTHPTQQKNGLIFGLVLPLQNYFAILHPILKAFLAEEGVSTTYHGLENYVKDLFMKKKTIFGRLWRTHLSQLDASYSVTPFRHTIIIQFLLIICVGLMYPNDIKHTDVSWEDAGQVRIWMWSYYFTRSYCPWTYKNFPSYSLLPAGAFVSHRLN